MYCQKGGCGRYAQYATFKTGKHGEISMVSPEL